MITNTLTEAINASSQVLTFATGNEYIVMFMIGIPLLGVGISTIKRLFA